MDNELPKMGVKEISQAEFNQVEPWGAEPNIEAEAETLAEQFHETYERLAEGFGYKTRGESAVPWANVPQANKLLMIATCAELLLKSPISLPESLRKQAE